MTLTLAVPVSTEFALEASAEALARARGALAELEDTGETRGDHEEAGKAHRRAAHAHALVAASRRAGADFEGRMAHDSAAARHRAAASAHDYARALGDASADDPKEDGTGIEAGSRATSAALDASRRAHEATNEAADLASGGGCPN